MSQRRNLKQRLALSLSLSFVLTNQMVAFCHPATPTAAPPRMHNTAPVMSASNAAPQHSSSRSLDLSSVVPAVSASHLVSSGVVNIHVGSGSHIVSSNSILTPAEVLAVYQIVHTGTQSIQLGNAGNAIGGSFNIGGNFNKHFNSLIIPKGVTAVDNFASGTNLNLSGNLVNSGHLLAVSTNPQVHTASISAANILNEQGGLITSVIPQGKVAGYLNLLPGLSLNLSAEGNIVNAGQIVSAGNLNITAGGALTNASSAGASGAAPLIQANNNVTLQAQTIVNQGLINTQLGSMSIATASLTNSGVTLASSGSISIQSLLGNQLAVNNAAGKISARDTLSFSTPGNVLDSAGNVISKASLLVSDGDFSAHDVVFTSPNGIVNVQANRIDGAVAVTGGKVEVGSNVGGLNIASMNVTGDPIFFSHDPVAGLVLSGLGTTGGGDFVALSEGNIPLLAQLASP